MMDVFLDTHLYGKKKVSESPMSWRGKDIMIKGKPLYLSKILDSLTLMLGVITLLLILLLILQML